MCRFHSGAPEPYASAGSSPLPLCRCSTNHSQLALACRDALPPIPAAPRWRHPHLPACPQTLKIIRYTTRLLLCTALAGSRGELAARLKDFEGSIGTSRKGRRCLPAPLRLSGSGLAACLQGCRAAAGRLGGGWAMRAAVLPTHLTPPTPTL